MFAFNHGMHSKSCSPCLGVYGRKRLTAASPENSCVLRQQH